MQPSDEEREQIAGLFPPKTTVEVNRHDCVETEEGDDGCVHLSLWFWGARHGGTVRIDADKRAALAAALSPAAGEVIAAAREWHDAYTALDEYMDDDTMQAGEEYAAGLDRWQRANAGLHAAVGALGGSADGEGSEG